MSELLYWIWLSLSCTPGSDTFKKLIEKFSEPKAVYESSEAEIASVLGSRSKDYKAVTDKDIKRAEKILDFCTSKNVGILTYGDERFPHLLREIENPPVLLYYRGILPNFNKSACISVVGTRRLSEYGRDNTFKISYDLARSGAVIVSGMAHGVDGVAHAGALASGAPTVAVLGSGINVCYPKVHLNLAREIVKTGCVITEYPPNEKPAKYNFPTRNRIISGICKATIVMEGRERSGSLITATLAKNQNRLVFALPGNVDNKYSEATNLLIKNGAGLITSADDVVRCFDKLYPGSLSPFSLDESRYPDMYEALLTYNVSCVTAADKIFSPKRNKGDQRRKNEEGRDRNTHTVQVNSHENEVKIATDDALKNFNKDTVALYKKIPLDSDCSIEELVDSQHSLPSVMQNLLTLEIAGIVTMLPGDRVKRN